ncbi:hypothetical protein BB561_001504 [Smittium simulii]|uniref:Small ribosomal subunit protein mS29 n=1 Tax=Smittium simulii TaxID=133385 RepID=A0A2T9YUA3_9FUNG|nr:hypothetical protein BB561_001504 [Smittium simulii]
MLFKKSLQKTLPQLSLRTTNNFASNYRAFSVALPTYAAKKPIARKTVASSFKKKPKSFESKSDYYEDSKNDNKNPNYYKQRTKLQFETLSFDHLINDSQDSLYSINGQLAKAYGPVPFPPQLSETFDTMGNYGLVLRDASKAVLQKVADSSLNVATKPLILDGGSGSGKSATLLQAVSCARQAGWFLLYSGNSKVFLLWVNSSTAYSPDGSKPSKFYQLNLVSSILSNLIAANQSDILEEKIKLQKDYVINNNKFAAGTPIIKVIELGANFPSLSFKAFEIVLETISNQTEVPVMIAIDHLNTFFSKSLYTDQEDNRIYSNRLLLVESLLPYFGELTSKSNNLQDYPKKSLKRGIVIGATSKVDNQFLAKDFLNYIDTEAKTSNDVEVINIPNFTKSEIEKLLKYYSFSDFLSYDPSDQNLLKLLSLTSGNPKQIYKYCKKFV